MQQMHRKHQRKRRMMICSFCEKDRGYLYDMPMIGGNCQEMEIEREVMEIFLHGLVLLGLVIEAVEDIREKKVWLPIVLFEIPVLFICNYWMGKWNLCYFVASVGLGALFYLISVVTKGEIGKGDAFVFCMTGAGIGLMDNLLVIYITFLLAFIAGIVLWFIKRVGKKYRMPLVPFILCAYLLVAGSRLQDVLG